MKINMIKIFDQIGKTKPSLAKMHNIEVVGLQSLSTDGKIRVPDILETIDIIIEYQIPAVFIESSINENSIRAVLEGEASAGFEVAFGGRIVLRRYGSSRN